MCGEDGPDGGSEEGLLHNVYIQFSSVQSLSRF